MIVLLILGVFFVLLGAVFFGNPLRTREFEQRISSARLEATIPKFWNGHQSARMRFTGVGIMFGGALLIVAGLFGRH
jgi:NADH:ubiquinone oxidoreductase subunit 3 (subunit A)